MITPGVCNSYKKELFEGTHSVLHDYYIALFYEESNLDTKTKTYSEAIQEIEGFGYDKGGLKLENPKVVMFGAVAVLVFDDVKWENVSFEARAALVYNGSLPNKNAVAVLDFGDLKSCINGNFLISFSPDEGLISIV